MRKEPILTQAIRQQVIDTIVSELKRRDIRKGEFADLMEVSNTQVSRWFSGEYNFTHSLITRIELKLGITIVSFHNFLNPLKK